MTPKNRLYNTIEVLQLQKRIQDAITDADIKGVLQCSVSTTNRFAVEDAVVPFQQLGYEVHVFQREGAVGNNLVWLPRTEILIKLAHLGNSGRSPVGALK